MPTKEQSVFWGQYAEAVKESTAENFLSLVYRPPKNNLQPPVPTRKGYGERLTEQFPENSFDLIHARNSIDHCLDPVVVIFNCVRALKPGCHFYLYHYRNEGSAADYYGLHQWNFDELNGQFVVSDRFGNVISISSALEGMARVTSVEIQGDRIIVVIQKSGS